MKRKKEESDFFGSRLLQARTLRAMTQADLGADVGEKPTGISRLERDKKEPDTQLVAALADALGVLGTYFSRPVLEKFGREECSFRHLQSTSKRLLGQAMSRGECLQEVVAELQELVELPPVRLPRLGPAETSDDLESAATEARDFWGLGRGPITNCIRLAENCGVLVTRLRGSTVKVDAFSRLGDPPIIVLSSTKGSASADRFTVAHELGHLLLQGRTPRADTASERKMDRFAAALLLPAAAFEADVRRLPKLDWAHLLELKRHWKASLGAILHRIGDLTLIGAAAHRKLYRQYYWRGWHKGEPYEPQFEQPELLRIALRVAKDETGLEIAHLAQRLGWKPAFFEEVTGLSVPKPPQKDNVTSLDFYRARRA